MGIITTDQVTLRDPKIRPQVHIASVDVGGLLPDEAEKKLREAMGTASVAPILVTDNINVWFIQPADIDFSIDFRGSVAAAYSIGRDADFIKRWKERLTANDQPQLLPVTVDVNRSKLKKALSSLALLTDRKSKDASLLVQFKTKKVELVPAIEGRKLDVEKSVAQAFRLPQKQMAFVIDLVFETQKPKIPDEHYSGINTMLATYSTHFKPWDDNRNANLRLATSRIHGTVLKPGEVFSYNKSVGHRTQQEGFRMAPVILDGKLVPDWGGGVCQVSSTLYNAALLADLDVVDRSNHGRAIGYVPLGFDATVVDGLIDFQFKNNLKRPVLLYSVITDNELMFSILGNEKDAPPPIELDYVVHKVIEPVEIKQPDPTLEVGKEEVEESPQRGFRVSTYRIRTINGKQVSQLLATDDYDPVNRIVKVGTKTIDGKAPIAVNPTKTTEKPIVKPTPKLSSGTITLNEKPLRTQSPSKVTTP
jgi:vancomycin resistance protein YoaR